MSPLKDFLLALLAPPLAVLAGVLMMLIKAPALKASDVRAHAAPAAR